MPIRVLIADDQEVVRRGMRRILDSQADIEVVAEAADGLAALEQADRVRPDVALLDVRMPGLDGLEVTRRLAGPDARTPVKVVVVTTFDLDEYVYPALRNGASGFLLKKSGPVLLVEAVRAAVNGDTLISPSITVRLLRQVVDTRPEPRAPLEPLTGREVEVAGKVAEGLTNADIGAELFIGAGTVKTHVAAIQRKLGVRNRVGIALWAHEMGCSGKLPS
ncbi:response regulator transcription factor [Umezawaea sp. Da 62-37]|uniref:response regulator transcription factor n=1 Tax=Umezawaea sp. Da 62-37 TaxID=3075927 RepID=UPI0028F71031|nr:response regulator transcription factor [Umezawaea sp. Da 62-37]WNV85789.1 response regulator transcription factor [Umezawaea sp. Da 62-37]